jgi:CRISPR-associated protein Cas2
VIIHTYLVTYDISSPRRWSKVYKTLKAFGEHVQLSVFRCDLSPRRLVRLKAALSKVIHHEEDQVVIVKLGVASEQTIEGIEVLGRPHAFEKPEPTIV